MLPAPPEVSLMPHVPSLSQLPQSNHYYDFYHHELVLLALKGCLLDEWRNRLKVIYFLLFTNNTRILEGSCEGSLISFFPLTSYHCPAFWFHLVFIISKLIIIIIFSYHYLFRFTHVFALFPCPHFFTLVLLSDPVFFLLKTSFSSSFSFSSTWFFFF